MSELIPIAGLTAAAGWSLRKLTGGAIDELGLALQRWTAKRVGNVEEIVRRAEARATDLGAVGEVHPRVVRRLIDEGSFVDDPLMQEYLAGLLLQARRPAANDDALYFTRIVTDLTSLQIGLHHAIYSCLIGAGTRGDRRALYDHRINAAAVEIPMDDLCRALRLDEEGKPRLAEALLGLHREGLIANGYQLLWKREEVGEMAYPGVLALPSALGAGLFLQAYASKLDLTEMLEVSDMGVPWVAPRPRHFVVRDWKLHRSIHVL